MAKKQIIHYKRKPISPKIPSSAHKKTLKKDLEIDRISENNKKNFWLPLLAVLITFVVYLPTFQNTFTNWDDTHYVLENHLIDKLDWQTIKTYFFSDKSYERFFMGNYHPLTMISLNVSYLLAKKDADGKPSAFPFQLGNILLHLISVFFIFLIIEKLTKNKYIAFLTALFFGINALHVESVAWISERKDVLYTAFYLISLFFYIKYIENQKISNYWTSLIIFLLSLLSKGQAVSLTLTLFLIDFWYNRKIFSTRVIIEKIPFLALSIIFGLIAIEAQKYGSALQQRENYPIFRRFAIASYGFTMYLIKLLFPFHLSAIYPYPDIINKTVPSYFWLTLIPTTFVALVWIFSFLKKNKILFFSLGFFILNIVFLLQIIPVGGAIYADRYSYIPSIGIHFLLAYFLINLAQKQNYKYLIIGLSSVYVIFMSFLTIQRIKVWKNSETLWADTVSKEPKAVVGWNNYGSVLNKQANQLLEQGKFEEFKKLKIKAIQCFDTAIAQKPDYKSAFYNRAMTIYELAKQINDTTMMFKAIKDLDKAITIDPVFLEAYKQRGTIYDWLGEYQKAIIDYSTVIKLNPKDATSYVNRAVTYGKSGKFDLAIKDLKKAISIKPDLPEAYSNLGLAYYYKNQFDSALVYLNKAIELQPNASAYFNRSLVFTALKKYDLAVSDLQKTISLGRKTADVYYFLGINKIYSGDKTGCKQLEISAKSNFSLAQQALKKYCQ